ncbi:hypothetical protein M422DRAFT_251707 [Sphaerobolus stellatus SS14]|uniref:Uncharacterized protein n=1 Tax=Sphaerobolus stellatus (strain SS14) TaxID=990650 RepID=A0A0C9W011_SPHS4|nr:hypothetical protein M422DRAFT_251707 [Sphaerobolus stellatus SS14]
MEKSPLAKAGVKVTPPDKYSGEQSFEALKTFVKGLLWWLDMHSMLVSGDAPRFPPGTFPLGTTPRVNHPQGWILHGIHPQHIRRLLWPESGRFGWKQWSSGGGYMRIES